MSRMNDIFITPPRNLSSTFFWVNKLYPHFFPKEIGAIGLLKYVKRLIFKISVSKRISASL